MKYKVLDLFSGIGGFSLGLERTGGFETVAFCEIEEYPRKVLNKHWPGVPIYEDIRELTADRLRADGIVPDVITGGFPCQDISVAGKQKGIEAERSGLWTELARLIGEIRPRYAIVENVTALLSGESGRWFQRVLGDLAEVGYDCEWHCIPASELGAHHHRDRVWIIAYTSEKSIEQRAHERGKQESQNRSKIRNNTKSDGEVWNVGNTSVMYINGSNNYREDSKREIPELGNASGKNIVSNPGSEGLQRREEYGIFGKGRERWQQLIAGQFCGFKEISQVEPTICRDTDGVSYKSYTGRLKGLGNAVCPQIPELIGRAILENETI